MNRFLLFSCALIITLGAKATDYTERMTVYVNGSLASNSQSTISLNENTDGTYALELKDFSIDISGQEMNVGTIAMNNVAKFSNEKGSYLYAKDDVTIANGSDNSKVWMGPMLGSLPIELLAKFTDSKLYTVISIGLTGMNVKVIFGDGYQIPNSDFESFHQASARGFWGNTYTSDEPNRWHSFMSVTGTYSSFINTYVFTNISTDIRPGSVGSRSVVVNSNSVAGVVSNGTITTGQMNAGSISASNTANNSFLSLDNTARDRNGDPFYVEFAGRPDSIAVWVKFKQNTPNSSTPYASLRAAITNGTYYQIPENTTYNNVVARAENVTITENGGVWQRLSIPFVYTSDNVDAKAVLVTIATNATPGGGSVGDVINVDDLELIYNTDVEGISVQGRSIGNFSENVSNYNVSISGTIDESDIIVNTKSESPVILKQVNGQNATVIVASDDLSSVKVYNLTLETTTGINEVSNTTEENVSDIYNINGVKVNGVNSKGIYIIKTKTETKKVVR